MAYKFQVGTAIMSGAVQVIDDYDISGSGDVTLSGDLKVNGSAYGLTHAGVATIASMGGNWTNASRTVADMGTVTTIDINGGSIDGTTIGAASQSSVKATTLSASSTLQVAGASSLGGKLDIHGAISGSGVLQVAGKSDLGGALTVKSTISGSGAISAAGNIKSKGDLLLNHDGAEVHFGDDVEVKLIHDHGRGLVMQVTGNTSDTMPKLTLRNLNESTTDEDGLGEIHFSGQNDDSSNKDYFTMFAKIEDSTVDSEDGGMRMKALVNGSSVDILDWGHSDSDQWTSPKLFKFNAGIKLQDGQAIGSDNDPDTITLNSGVTTFNFAQASTSKSTGAIVLNGSNAGIGVDGRVSAGNTKLYDTGTALSSAGDVHIAGDVLMGANSYIGVNGDADLLLLKASELNVNGGVVAAGEVSGSGNFSAGGDLSVDGTATFRHNVTGSGKIEIAGAAAFGSTLTVNGGAAYIDAAGEITASALNINDTLRIHGNGKLTSSTEIACLSFKVGSAGAYGITQGGAMTIASMAANWTNAGRTVADMGIVTTIDINGGSIDGTTIGAASPSSGKFTTLSASSNVDIAGNLEVDGNLTVRGATTVVSSSNLLIQDRLIGMAFSGSGDAGPVSDRALIMGLEGENNVAVMWDESADQFAFVRTTTDPDSTAGEVAITSYADLRVKSIVGGQSISVDDFSGAGALTDGYNYAAAALNAAVTMTLPASPTAGDVVYVKGNGNTAVAKAITVSGSTGSKATFDGGNPVQIVSPYGAVNLICVDATSGAEKWSIY